VSKLRVLRKIEKLKDREEALSFFEEKRPSRRSGSSFGPIAQRGGFLRVRDEEAKKVEYTEERLTSGVIRRRRIHREEAPPPPPKEELEKKAEESPSGASAIPSESPLTAELQKIERLEKPEKPEKLEKPEKPERKEPPSEKEVRFVRIPKDKTKPARIVGRIELKPEEVPRPEVPKEVSLPKVPPPPQEPVTFEVQVVSEVPKKKPFIRKEEEEEKREKKFPKRKGGKRPREVVSFDEEELEELYAKQKVLREYKAEKKTLSRPPQKPQITVPKAIKRKIRVEEEIPLSELAQRMGVKLSEIEEKIVQLGLEVGPEGIVDVETAALIASEYGFEVESALEELEKAIAPLPDPPEALKPRPPVVTIMGHVDHGKTTLLDAIRHTNVAEKEIGGITQKIGAYQVEIPKKGTITFIDTPGHEAFTAMRARGAQVTDIVVLVVAADDGVMPQTVEAINHAKAASVPIIVAINKVDKKEANPERVKRQLAEHGLIPEEWGGDTIFVEVSALKKQGIEELLEMILLQAEMMELRANPSKPGRGVVIETRLDRGKGPVGTVIVKEGRLKEGDYFVAGLTYGRIRAMEDDRGRRVKEALPSTPVEVIGFEELPEAGDDFVVVKDEDIAKAIAELRQKRKARLKGKGTPVISLEELFQKIQEGEAKELRIVLKADTFGSLQAIKGALEKLSTEEVKIKVIHEGVGGISESDVNLAYASKAVIIGFNAQPIGKAKDTIAEKGVEVRVYRIIYELLEDVQKALKGMLEPKKQEITLGRAEVKAVFNIPKVGPVAGCYVIEGKVARSGWARIWRGKDLLYEGKIGSLKRFKEDVREVQQGYECGLSVEGFKDWKEGDIIEVYTFEEVPIG